MSPRTMCTSAWQLPHTCTHTQTPHPMNNGTHHHMRLCMRVDRRCVAHLPVHVTACNVGERLLCCDNHLLPEAFDNHLRTMLCYVVLCCAVLCCAVLCCVMLCYVTGTSCYARLPPYRYVLLCYAACCMDVGTAGACVGGQHTRASISHRFTHTPMRSARRPTENGVHTYTLHTTPSLSERHTARAPSNAPN